MLREVEIAERELVAASASAGDRATKSLPLSGRMRAEMQAMAGLDSTIGGGAAVSGGRLGIHGELGEYEFGVSGDYRQLAAPSFGDQSALGESHGVSFRLENAENTRLRVTTVDNHLGSAAGDGASGPVDFSLYQLSWSQRVGAAGRSSFAAQYLSESNFYRQSWTDLAGVPSSSQTWRIEGSYVTELNERHSLQAGLRFRLRDADLAGAKSFSPVLGDGAAPAQSLDLYARGGWRVQPTMLVEYGLYTTLADGSLAVMPHGGLVVQLDDAWQAGATVTRRVYDERQRSADLVPSFHGESSGCDQGEDSCYRVFLSYDQDDGDGVLLAAAHREVGETVRLYFSRDLFDHLGNLFLVRGDRLPELQLRFRRELAPRIVATLESTLAEGGGGQVVALDDVAYVNAVRYLVTSLDTRFDTTSTGVFLAFHRLEQQLDPVHPGTPTASPLELERLQLLLTQDLNVLLDLAANWAVQLNMELSRGSSAYSETADGGVAHRVMGGFSVSF